MKRLFAWAALVAATFTAELRPGPCPLSTSRPSLTTDKDKHARH